jgi:hypothetical protein
MANSGMRRIPASFTRRNMIVDHSALIAVGDYAAEIEKAVGTEVYTPIFKAGLFLFVSGIVSAFVAAFIISKSDSWEGLNDEFERGKESKLIASDITPFTSSNKVSSETVINNIPAAPLPVAVAVGSNNVLDEVKDLDL